MPSLPDTIAAIERWLEAPPPPAPIDDIDTLRRHLVALGELRAPAATLQRVLDRLHARAQSSIEAIVPKLYSVKLPISPKTRQTVRFMQDALDALTRISLDLVEAPDSQLVKGLGTPPDVALWRIIHAIGRNIALSNLTASPYPPGCWISLHRAYLAARLHRVEGRTPIGAAYPLQSLYARVVLLGALPVSALNAQEWSFAHRFVLRMPLAIEVSDGEPEATDGSVLWIAPGNDMAPMLRERKAPADGTLAIFIRYAGLAASLARQAALLADNARAGGLLPEDVAPRTARIVLQRIAEHLGAPRKRRFPRRRQGYRATLCFTFEDIVRVLATRSDAGIDLSEWMIVNESPGGYAAMHVAGKPHKVQVGDLIGMLREGEDAWSVCIVRWALNENQEHLELGLQELSPRVALAHMATPGLARTGEHPALLLPPVPPLREAEAIAFAPVTRPAEQHMHVLVLAGPTTQVREFRLGATVEQSADVEVALIAEDTIA